MYFLRLAPDEDVLAGLQSAIKEVGIHTGLVTSITGSLHRARLQHFPHVGRECGSVDVLEVEGPLEVTGQGIIGATRGSGGVGGYVDGEPYVHVHLVVTGGLGTWCGHLMEGCKVRAHHEISHFTFAIVPVSGIALTLVAQEARSGQRGFVYHELREVKDS
ncbi:MAG: PPC domain-containing DNA-binding protein [Trueperaceae bacterium]